MQTPDHNLEFGKWPDKRPPASDLIHHYLWGVAKSAKRMIAEIDQRSEQGELPEYELQRHLIFALERIAEAVYHQNEIEHGRQNYLYHDDRHLEVQKHIDSAIVELVTRYEMYDRWLREGNADEPI